MGEEGGRGGALFKQAEREREEIGEAAAVVNGALVRRPWRRLPGANYGQMKWWNQ